MKANLRANDATDGLMFRGVKKDRAINCVSYRKREPGARNWRDNSSQNRHAGKSLRVERANRRGVRVTELGSLPRFGSPVAPHSRPP